MSKITDVVSWVMQDNDNILKLKKNGKTYDISDEVVKFLVSKGLFDILENKSVEVEIDESKASGEEDGSSGLITRLVLTDGKATTEEPKPNNTPPASDVPDGLVVKTITVGGVSVPKESAVDKETKTWYNLDSTIDAQKFKDECTGEEVKITIAPQEKGNDVIKGYVVMVKEEPEKEPVKDPEKKIYNGNSIEAQASLKCAKQIVSAMVDKDSNGNDVCGMITKIATHSYKLIQDLKNKG